MATIKNIALFLFFVIPYVVCGQIKIHKHLTSSDGLVNDIVTVITQDAEGHIWFGTENGLSRWDGINFLNFQKHNGLPTSYVSDIKIANDSSVYISTFGGGIIVYKDSQLDTLDESDGLITNWINKILIKKTERYYLEEMMGEYLSLIKGGSRNGFLLKY